MSEPTNKTYRIRTVNDLLDVPEDRLCICVLEIGAAVASVRPLRKKFLESRAKLPRVLRVFFPRWLVRLGAVRWIDDGKFEASINGRKLSDDWVEDSLMAGVVKDPTQ